MATLTSLIPDIDVLVALAPEELAEIVLQLTHERGQKHHLQVIASDIHGSHGTNTGYPQNRKADAELALAEAWNWLSVQGLLIPEPGSNGTNGWMLLSRRARAVLASNTFKTYARSVAFPKTLLHPGIADEVWLDIVRGDLETAVFKSFRAVEIAVREAGNFADADIGTALMRKAFDKTSGLFPIRNSLKLNVMHWPICLRGQLVHTRIRILIAPLLSMTQWRPKRWWYWQAICSALLIAGATW